MSDPFSSCISYCQEGCKTRLTKSTCDSHTIWDSCRRQICTKERTCDECKDWDNKQWKVLKYYVDKLGRDRKRKAASRAESRVRSLEPIPKPSVVDDLSIPPSPVPALSPIPSPPTIVPPTTVLSFHASDPDPIASLECRFDYKIDLVVNTVAELGASLRVLMDSVQ